jgi:hypothetical protein
MATYYWVGGNGTWNNSNTTNWSNASGGASGFGPPLSTDTVIFDSASGTGTCTTASGSACAAATLNSSTLGLSLGANHTMSGTFTLTLGALSLGANTLTANVFSSNNSNTRSIAFGTGNITLAGSGTTIWTTGAATGFTLTGTPVVNCTYSGSTGTRIIIHGNGAGGSISNAVSFNISAGSDGVSIASASYIRNLDFTGFSGSMNNFGPNICGDYKISSGMTVVAGSTATTFLGTTTQKITCNGKTLDFPITINGVGCVFQIQDTFTQGSSRSLTLTNGSIDLFEQTFNTGFLTSNNSNIRGVTFGSGTFNVTGSGASVWSVDPTTNFTVSGTATVNATYSGGTGTRTINPGTPTEAQAVNFNFTSGSDTVALTGSRNFGSLDFTGFTGTLTNTAITIYGNLKLVSGMTMTAGANAMTFAATAAKQITTALKTLDFPLTFNGVGGTFSFQDALTQGSTRAFTITNGSVKLKNNVTSTVGSFVTSGTNQKYLQSTVDGSQATLSDASGVNTVTYLSISDINVTGGATWNARTDQGAKDISNNSGWNFFAVGAQLIIQQVMSKILRPIFRK